MQQLMGFVGGLSIAAESCHHQLATFTNPSAHSKWQNVQNYSTLYKTFYILMENTYTYMEFKKKIN